MLEFLRKSCNRGLTIFLIRQKACSCPGQFWWHLYLNWSITIFSNILPAPERMLILFWLIVTESYFSIISNHISYFQCYLNWDRSPLICCDSWFSSFSFCFQFVYFSASSETLINTQHRLNDRRVWILRPSGWTLQLSLTQSTLFALL